MAEKADCHPDTARTYLEWFARLGLAHRHDGRPTTYERNEAYFEWRYVNELAERHTQAELREHVQEIEKELEHLRDTYDAPNPGLVDAQAHATEDTPVEDVWNELSRWATLEEELRLLDRARRRVVTNRSSHAIRS
ncbi:MAG: sugar-specific transcriptional regulator TrmB [Halodesulfurarchaeum sp.]